MHDSYSKIRAVMELVNATYSVESYKLEMPINQPRSSESKNTGDPEEGIIRPVDYIRESQVTV